MAMYVPEHFDEQNVEAVHTLMTDHPFATLIANGSSGLLANHLPFVFDAENGSSGILRAHVARANDVWRLVPDGAEVLVVFQGSQHYVSPSWYPSKHESHRQVPTWNYQVVQARGTIAWRHDEPFLRGIVAQLTKIHEAGEPVPWRMSDAQPDYLAEMLRNIVGLEIAVTSLRGKSKLSQNKEDRDRRGAAETLRERGAADLADAMLP
jgi:transcriptional regulator